MIKVTDLKTVLTAEQLNELEYQAEKSMGNKWHGYSNLDGSNGRDFVP